MTKRATFRQADLDRAIRVAEKHVGWRVEIENGTIRLLPTGGDAASSAADAERRMREAFGE